MTTYNGAEGIAQTFNAEAASREDLMGKIRDTGYDGVGFYHDAETLVRRFGDDTEVQAVVMDAFEHTAKDNPAGTSYWVQQLAGVVADQRVGRGESPAGKSLQAFEGQLIETWKGLLETSMPGDPEGQARLIDKYLSRNAAAGESQVKMAQATPGQ